MDSINAVKVILRDDSEISDVVITEHEKMRGFSKLEHSDGKIEIVNTYSIKRIIQK